MNWFICFIVKKWTLLILSNVSEESITGETEHLDDDVRPVHFTSVQQALDAIIPKLNINSPPQLDEGTSVQTNEPMESAQT